MATNYIPGCRNASNEKYNKYEAKVNYAFMALFVCVELFLVISGVPGVALKYKDIVQLFFLVVLVIVISSWLVSGWRYRAEGYDINWIDISPMYIFPPLVLFVLMNVWMSFRSIEVIHDYLVKAFIGAVPYMMMHGGIAFIGVMLFSYLVSMIEERVVFDWRAVRMSAFAALWVAAIYTPAGTYCYYVDEKILTTNVMPENEIAFAIAKDAILIPIMAFLAAIFSEFFLLRLSVEHRKKVVCYMDMMVFFVAFMLISFNYVKTVGELGLEVKTVWAILYLFHPYMLFVGIYRWMSYLTHFTITRKRPPIRVPI